MADQPTQADFDTPKLDVPDLDAVEIFCGELTDYSARVVARLPSASSQTYRLTGTIRGPYCASAKTLPAQISLVALDGTVCPTAMVALPDPCFWSAATPHLYEVELHLEDASLSATTQSPAHRRPHTLRRMLAIRPVSVRGTNLYWASRRWVLRAISRDTAPGASVEEFQAAAAAMLLTELDEPLAEQSARHGVPLLMRLSANQPEDVEAELRRLAQFPAVTMAILDADAALAVDLRRRVAPNVLLAAYLNSHDTKVPDWADLLFCDAADAFRIRAAVDKPLIACRLLERATDVATARRECDLLQRDMVPCGDLSGYIV